jgi:cell shape-determining protein MreC
MLMLKEREVARMKEQQENDLFWKEKAEKLEKEKEAQEKKEKELLAEVESLKGQLKQKNKAVEEQLAFQQKRTREMAVNVQVLEEKIRKMEEAKAIEIGSMKALYEHQIKKAKENSEKIAEE